MGILSRVRARGEAFIARRLQDRAVALSLALPGRAPLCEMRFEAESEPQADGERVRLRAHLHVRFPGALRRDFKSWVEVRASNVALDDGSVALVPERLKVLGIEPQRGKPVQTWAGGLGGRHPGYAMLTLLQLDKERLPAPVRSALGSRPFQLTATVVNVVEDA